MNFLFDQVSRCRTRKFVDLRVLVTVVLTCGLRKYLDSRSHDEQDSCFASESPSEPSPQFVVVVVLMRGWGEGDGVGDGGGSCRYCTKARDRQLLCFCSNCKRLWVLLVHVPF